MVNDKGLWDLQSKTLGCLLKCRQIHGKIASFSVRQSSLERDLQKFLKCNSHNCPVQLSLKVWTLQLFINRTVHSRHLLRQSWKCSAFIGVEYFGYKSLPGNLYLFLAQVNSAFKNIFYPCSTLMHILTGDGFCICRKNNMHFIQVLFNYSLSYTSHFC